MSQTFTYIDTDAIFATWLSELRSKIKNYFLEEKLLKVLGNFIRKNNASKPFTFVDYTVHSLVDLLHPLYKKIEKRDLLRFILLVMLGNDALPKKVDEPRYRNTKVLLGEGPLKDDLIKDLKVKFPDVECAYPIITDPHRGKNCTNYALVVYFGKFATAMRAEVAHKKAEKAAKRQSIKAEESDNASKSSSEDNESTSTVSWADQADQAEKAETADAVDTMEQQILKFASKKGAELSSAVISFVVKLGFAQQAENGTAPDWNNYGKLCDMINTILANYVVDHPECVPE